MSKEYSIWLVPDEDSETYSVFDEAISEYSRKYLDAPDFKPHVTVLGGLEENRETVEEYTQTLAEGQERLELTITAASCSVTNHQCVFLLVSPSVELLELHQNALNLFDANPSMYVPHLSLIYSEMDLEDRVHEVQSIEMDSLPKSVGIDTIEVFDTTGAVQNWERTSKCSLVE